MPNTCNKILLLLVLCIFLISGKAQEEDTDELGKSYGFHEHERPCSYRRQQGFCRRRSACRRPTRNVCRLGLNPVVCCLDEPEVKPTTTVTTQRPFTTRNPDRRGTVKEIDLTFPNCGYRIPKVGENGGRGTTNAHESNRGRSSFRSRRSSSMFKSRRTRGLFDRGNRKPINPVIVGGVTAVEYSWPWMVAIFKETSPRTPKRFLCGASLISQKFVLTAAHCFDGERGNIDPSKFFIVVGSHSTKDGTEYPVQNVLVHPSYKTRQYYNDICLLQVARQVTLTKKVYPICVPSDGLRNKIMPSNNNVTVTGWGDTSFGGVSSKVLQELTIPIVPLKGCNESYSVLNLSNFPKGITNLFICAGVKEGGKDACQGDSGGPLVTKLKDNSYAQLGIVSFGYGCAQAGFPGVYTRVSQFAKWLYDNTDLGK